MVVKVSRARRMEAEVDEEIEPDSGPMDDAKSQAQSAIRLQPSMGQAPQISLGSMAAPPVPKKRKTEKREKEKGGEVAQEGETGEEIVEGNVDFSKLPNWMGKDTTMQRVISKLGKVHKCFFSLDPEALLRERAPIGHKLTGAGRGKGECCSW